MNTIAHRMLASRVLFGVSVFNALSALGGGIALVVGGLTGGSAGMGMPLSMLEGTPFDTFLWPGVILALAVGGTQLLVVVAQLARSAWWPLAAAVAGFGLLIWMFVEVALLPGFGVLQGVYFGAGILQLALLSCSLGVLPEESHKPAYSLARSA